MEMKWFFSEMKTYLISYVIIFPLFLVIALLNQFVRCILSCLFLFSKYKLAIETDNLFKVQPDVGTILAVLYCDGGDNNKKWDISKEQDNFRKCVLDKIDKNGGKIYEKFQHVWCQKFGYGCWRNDISSFDIMRHVKLVDFGGSPITEEKLLKEILPPLARSMPDSHPQWEWLVIHNVLVDSTQIPQTVRVFRYHHSYMDGVSAGIMLADLLKFETKTQNESPFVVDPYTAPPLKSRVLGFYYKCIAPLLFPLFLGRGILLEKSGQVPKDPFATVEYCGKLHLVQSKLVDSNVFRKIKDRRAIKSGGSVQSVAINIFKDAVQRLYVTGGAKWNGEIVQLSTTFAVPPIPNKKPRNYFLIVPVPFGVEDNSELNFNLDSTAFTLRFLMEWGSSLPMKMACVLLAPNGLASSMYITNLPFTRLKGELWGNRVTQISGFVGIYRPMGFAISVPRYGNSFRFCATAEDNCLSRDEVQHIVDGMADQIEDMASDTNQNCDPGKFV